jgi:hypothetical protein
MACNVGRTKNGQPLLKEAVDIEKRGFYIASHAGLARALNGTGLVVFTGRGL